MLQDIRREKLGKSESKFRHGGGGYQKWPKKIPTSFMNGPLHIFHGRWRYRMSNKICNSRFSYKITAKLLNFKKHEQVKDYVYLNISIKIYCPLRHLNIKIFLARHILGSFRNYVDKILVFLTTYLPTFKLLTSTKMDSLQPPIQYPPPLVNVVFE